MKKKLSIIMALLAGGALFILVGGVVLASVAGSPDPNAAKGFNNCPADWWTAGGAPVDAGDITTSGATAVNVQYDGCLTQQELSHIQPGLGTVMIEVGYRAGVMYYAAQGGRWDLANYEGPMETPEIMEVGAITRPGKANALLNFMDVDGMPQVKQAITDHSLSEFNTAYANMINKCNTCHSAVGHPEINYHTPTSPPQDLKLTP